MFMDTWTLAHPQAGTSSGYSRISSSPTWLTSTPNPARMSWRATNDEISSEPWMRESCQLEKASAGDNIPRRRKRRRM